MIKKNLKITNMTEKDKTALINIFKNNNYSEIRDTLIDAKITDETFPHFYTDMVHGLSIVKGYLRMGNMLIMDGKKYKLTEIE